MGPQQPALAGKEVSIPRRHLVASVLRGDQREPGPLHGGGGPTTATAHRLASEGNETLALRHSHRSAARRRRSPRLGF